MKEAFKVTHLIPVRVWFAGNQLVSWPLLPPGWFSGIWNMTGGEGIEEKETPSWTNWVNNNVTH